MRLRIERLDEGGEAVRVNRRVRVEEQQVLACRDAGPSVVPCSKPRVIQEIEQDDIAMIAPDVVGRAVG